MADDIFDLDTELQKALVLSHAPHRDIYSRSEVPESIVSACKNLRTFVNEFQAARMPASFDIAVELAQKVNLLLEAYQNSEILVKSELQLKKTISDLKALASSLSQRIASYLADAEYNQLKRDSSQALQSASNAEIKINELNRRLNSAEEKLAFKNIPELEEEANAARDEIQKYLKSIRALAKATATEATTTSYNRYSDEEKNLSDTFRTYSIRAMYLAAAVPILSLIESIVHTIEPTGVAIRISCSILLSLPAAYFARESGRHRRQQYTYQQFALNLHTVDPFIADFEKTEKTKVKSEIAKVLFTSSHEGGLARDQGYPINPNELLTAIIGKMEFKPKSDSESEKNDNPKQPSKAEDQVDKATAEQRLV